MPVIHVYGFSKAQDPEFNFQQRTRTALLEFAVAVEIHRVWVVAPGKWMLYAFRGIFREKPRSIIPVIHVYGFSKAQDPEFDFHQRIRSALLEFAAVVEMHRVRVVAPGKWMLCASFTLTESVAFGRNKT